jgi:hypothetical protein
MPFSRARERRFQTAYGASTKLRCCIAVIRFGVMNFHFHDAETERAFRNQRVFERSGYGPREENAPG